MSRLAGELPAWPHDATNALRADLVLQRDMVPRPPGDGPAVQAAGRLWHDVAAELSTALATIQGPPLRWSGDARSTFDARSSRFSAAIRRTQALAAEVGDILLRLGLDIDDAQDQWRIGRTALPTSTGTSSSADAIEVVRARHLMEEASQDLATRADNALRLLWEAMISHDLVQELTWDPRIIAVRLEAPSHPAAPGSGSPVPPGRPATSGSSELSDHDTSAEVTGGGAHPAQVVTGADGHGLTGPGGDGLTGSGGRAHGGAGHDAAAAAAASAGSEATLPPGDVAVVLAVALAAAVLVARKQRGGEDGDASEEKPEASIEEVARTFSELEHSVAELLHAEGSEVTAVAEGSERTPSALVDGHPTAFKFLGEGANGQTVTNALNSATGQANSIVVGARGSGLTETQALAGLRRFLATHPTGISRVRIIGDGFDVTHPRRAGA